MLEIISPVQRLRALVCLCMRMAPQLRLIKPSQRGALHLNKQNMDDDMARTSILETLKFQSMAFGKEGSTTRFDSMAGRRWGFADFIVSSRSLSRTRWAQIAKEGWNVSFMGVLCLGSESKQTVGKNFLSVDGGPKVLMQRRVSSSCFPRAVRNEGFATTHEAWQLLLPFEAPHLEDPEDSPRRPHRTAILYKALYLTCLCTCACVRRWSSNWEGIFWSCEYCLKTCRPLALQSVVLLRVSVIGTCVRGASRSSMAMKDNIVKMMIVQFQRCTCWNWEGMWWMWLSSSWGGTCSNWEGML